MKWSPVGQQRHVVVCYLDTAHGGKMDTVAWSSVDMKPVVAQRLIGARGEAGPCVARDKESVGWCAGWQGARPWPAAGTMVVLAS